MHGGSPAIKSSTVSGNGLYGIFALGAGARIKGNHADANGFPDGAADFTGLGIIAANTAVGKNTARGNDDNGECSPASLC